MSSLYPLIIPLAPLIAAFFTVLPKRLVNNSNYKIGRLLIFAGFVCSLFVLGRLIQNPEPINFILFDLEWQFLTELRLSIDRLTAIMMLVISGFGVALYHYSVRYLQQDKGQSRFLFLLTLLVFSLLMMVMSTDFIVLLIFWQLLTWFFCLLFHNYSHLPTVQSSFRTFAMLRAGDLFFLGAIVLAYQLYGSTQFDQIFRLAAVNDSNFSIFGTGIEIAGVSLVTLLIFIAVMFKSVQFPVHIWLVDSLYAPTPVSAILHAGVINAGGFLLTKLAPLYLLSSTTLNIILLIGFITLVLGKSMMLVQNDVKKTLVYSTIGQMGYMTMECGIGAFPLAIFHLIAHGLFKAYLFLNSGDPIHQARQAPKSPSQQSESSLTVIGWCFAFLLSFLIPLLIMVLVHKLLGVAFLDFQGLFILFLFSWVASAQAMLTMFRLQRTLIAKTAMLFTIGFVALLYFFCAEQFINFLIPDHDTLSAYLRAAHLPSFLFTALVTILILGIFATWVFTFHRQNNDRRRVWLNWLKVKLYLLFINRLYLDGYGMKLYEGLRRLVRKSYACLLFCVMILHGVLLWYFFETHGFTSEALSFAYSLAFVLAGMFFVILRLRARFGALDLRYIGGLYQLMPRFTLCSFLLLMAAMGLPPFNLFFAYLEILFSPGLSPIFISIAILVLYVTSSYLFKFAKELFFGPCRTELYAEDLNFFEAVAFFAFITLNLIPKSCLLGVIQ